MPRSQLEAVDLMVVNASEVLTCSSPDAGRGVRGAALDDLEVLRDTAIAVRDQRIVAIGPAGRLAARYAARTTVDAQGGLVTPGLVDAHTHLVHGGSRHEEFERTVQGLPPDPARSGIRATITATRQASVDQLRRSLVERLDVMLEHGTTTTEVKSGYGITPELERRMLDVVDGLQHPVTVVPTFLGAHVIPAELVEDRAAAVALVTDQIPQVRHLVGYVDVCCEPGGYTPAEVRQIAQVAHRNGLRMRLHADHAGWVGGAEVAVQVGASSVDHLEHVSDQAIRMLAESDTVAVLFPAVTLHLRQMVATAGSSGERPPVHPDLGARFRRLVRSGALVALSTDYNPGSAPTLSMQLVMQLAARLYGLSAAQIWHLCTINPAVSLDRDGEVGSLQVGRRADLVLWSVPHHEMVIDSFGANLARTVITGGEVSWSRRRETRSTSSGPQQSLVGVAE